MNLQLSQLWHLQPIEKVIIHAIDLSLYRASILINDEEFVITDDNGKLLSHFNKIEIQRQFRPFEYKQMVLRHESAFDEMIAQPVRTGSNCLEVPIKDPGI